MSIGKMDHVKAMAMIGQLAVQMYLEKIANSEAFSVRLVEPPDRVNGLPGPIAYHFIFPRDHRVFIQYSDMAQFVN